MLFDMFKVYGRCFVEAREGNNTLILCFVKTNLYFCAIFLFWVPFKAVFFALVFFDRYVMLKGMKYLSFSLAVLLSCTSLLFAKSDKDLTTDLGKVMFVGDSITHGHSSSSYRWALHKLFVDNGMKYESVGIITGNQPKTVDILPAGTEYRDVEFPNVHSAQSSARAWEISGRKEGPRFGGSNIKNWLGQSNKTCTGSEYADQVFKKKDAPNYFLMMIGTNDLLSDHGNELEANARNAVGDLEKDVDVIVKSMRSANKSAPILLTTIPVWAHREGIDAEGTHTTVENYNEALKKAAKSRKVTVAEINNGLRDLSDPRPFHGHADLFAEDGLHPNNQGSLIIAGNIAKAMKWPSRTAGLERKASSEFEIQGIKKFKFIDVSKKTKGYMYLSGSKGKTSFATLALPDAEMVTLVASVPIGGGSKGIWVRRGGLRISIDTKLASGALLVTDSYLMWGDRVIYCTHRESNYNYGSNLRICYQKGDAIKGIGAGFYVWVNDKLVGEALPASAGTGKGIKFDVVVPGNYWITAVVGRVAVDPTGAYAPEK